MTFTDSKSLLGCYFRIWGALLTRDWERFDRTIKRANGIHAGMQTRKHSR
jgi:hypothetical protein